MANTIQDEIYQSFLEVSRQQAAALETVAGSLANVMLRSDQASPNLPQQSADTKAATSSLADVILQADQVMQDTAQQTAKTQSASSGSSGSGSSGSGGVAQQIVDNSPLSTVYDIFKSGLGVAPLIQGLIGLFSGGDSTAPPPLVKYALPPSVDFQAAEVNGTIGSVDYDQSGIPRAYGRAPAANTPAGAGGGGTSGAPAPQITVNVQAMDARSFLDRSNDIALAVRDAMLNLNAINDVVNDL